MSTAVAAPALVTPDAKLPAIDPTRVTINSDGYAWRSFMVRLPEGLTADDLKEPSIWRRVQTSRTGGLPLRMFDQLLLVAYDQSWVAEAIVAHADDTGVVLAKPRLTQFPARYDKLFEDNKYRVIWSGYGYRVQRKSDNQMMTDAVANTVLAERDLRNLYPKRAA